MNQTTSDPEDKKPTKRLSLNDFLWWCYILLALGAIGYGLIKQE